MELLLKIKKFGCVFETTVCLQNDNISNQKPGYSNLNSFIPHVSIQMKFYMKVLYDSYRFVVGTLIIHSGSGSGAMLVEITVLCVECLICYNVEGVVVVHPGP